MTSAQDSQTSKSFQQFPDKAEPLSSLANQPASANAGPHFHVVGRSHFGLPQFACTWNRRGPKVLILGGVHGDEYEGIAAADGILAELMKHNPYQINLTIVARLNPDGALMNTRVNGAGVDLNRNLPTKDWSPEARAPRYFPGPAPASEPENKFLIHYIETQKPALILSLHSWEPVLNINGDCLAEAEVLAKHTGYRIDRDIGYPTPGSLGTYAGLERPCPTLTYEIQRDSKVPDLLKLHVPAVLDALRVTEKRA